MASIFITRSWTSGSTTATYKLTVPYTVTNKSNTKTQIELGSFSTTKTGSGAAATLRDNAIASGLVLSFKLNGEDNSAVTLWQINTKNDIVQDTIGKTYSWTRTKEDNKTRAIWVMMTGVSHESQTINIPVKPSREINYDANGGTGTVSSQTKWYGENLTLRSNSFTKTNSSFYHWNTTSTNTGTSYKAGATYTSNPTSNDTLTLHAIWNPIITYNANGGNGTVSSQTKTYGTAINLKSNSFTKTGYSFYHWNTASNNSGTSYNAGASYTGNNPLTLYAIWNPIITYNANGGSGTVSSQTKTYGTNITLKSNSFTRSGYVFSHWNTASDNTGTKYNAGATYTGNTALTLYAIWNPIITYIPNGGSGSDITQTKTYGTNIVLKGDNTFTRTGYSLYRWNTKKDGTGTYYNKNYEYQHNTTLTLYAIWNPIITYKANGGSGTVDPQIKTFNKNIQLEDSNAFTKVDYMINEWNTKSDSSGSSYNPGSIYTRNNSLTLYAIWKKIYAEPTLKITGYRTDGSGNSSDSGTYLKIIVNWSFFDTNGADNSLASNGIKLIIAYKKDAPNQQWTSSSPFNYDKTSSGVSINNNIVKGTCTKILGGQLDSNFKYDIKVTLKDVIKGDTQNSDNLRGQKIATIDIPTAFFPIDISQQGKNMALGGAASDSTSNSNSKPQLDIYYNTNFYNSVYVSAKPYNVSNYCDAGIILARQSQYSTSPASQSSYNIIQASPNSQGHMNNYYRTEWSHIFYGGGALKLQMTPTQFKSYLPINIVSDNLTVGGAASISGNLTVNGTITSANPPFRWRYETSEAFTLTADEGKVYNFPSSIFTMPNISGYTRIAIPRTSNNNTVATGYAFNDDNTLNVYIRNLRSSSSSLYVRVFLFYLRNDLQWS